MVLLIDNFILPGSTRIETIDCFTEVVSLTLENSPPQAENKYKETICVWFTKFILKIMETVKGRSLIDEYNSVRGSPN